MLEVRGLRVQIPMRPFIYFQLTQSFQPHYGPWFDSASNRNEYLLGKAWPARKADDFAAVCESIV
jgi:hypothetical protein